MRNCPDCHGKKWLALLNEDTGLQKKDKDGRRLWKCFRCNHIEPNDPPFVPTKERKPSILYIDIEISLSEYWNYGNKVQSKYLSSENLVHEYYIICWAASYLGKKRVYWGCVSQDDALNWTDRNILSPLWELMDSADIIAGHNVDRFDIKRCNTRFLLNDMKSPKQYKTIDTLKIARSKFHFESNKLDGIARQLRLRGKDEVTGDDWREIARTGSPKTLYKISKYNANDVVIGKQVLEALLGWAANPLDFGATVFPKEKK